MIEGLRSLRVEQKTLKRGKADSGRAGSLVFSFGGKGVKLSRNNRLIEWFNE